LATAQVNCDLLVNAVIYGGGPHYFGKYGAGKMCLTAANAFGASTYWKKGILYVAKSSGLGSAEAVISDSATLQLQAVSFNPLNPPTLTNNLEATWRRVGGTHGALEVLGTGFPRGR